MLVLHLLNTLLLVVCCIAGGLPSLLLNRQPPDLLQHLPFQAIILPQFNTEVRHSITNSEHHHSSIQNCVIP
jgi:hypothetical protein